MEIHCGSKMSLSSNSFNIYGIGTSVTLRALCTRKTEFLPESEEKFNIRTFDFSRPDLKQIGNSLFEIKCHFMQNDTFSVVPTKFESPLAEIKDNLLQRLEDSNCLLHENNLVTRAPCPSQHRGTTRGFVFLSESLPMAFNFTSRPRPTSVKCDLLLQLPNQPAMVFTITEGDKTARDVRIYNTSVHRGVTTSLTRFLDISFKPVFGVLNHTDIKDTSSFNAYVRSAVKASKTFVSVDSMSMCPERYEKVLTAFWASLAEKSCVGGDRNEKAEFLHFLTKEQCIILVENINSKETHVTATPHTGATTLMLEVAKRLSRLDDTLLVVEKEEEVEYLRSLHPNTFTAADLSTSTMSRYKHIVDETNSFTPRQNGRLWTLNTEEATDRETGMLREKIRQLEKVNESRDDQMSKHVREIEMLKRHLSFKLREDDLLDLKTILNETNYSMDLQQSKCSHSEGASPTADKRQNNGGSFSSTKSRREDLREESNKPYRSGASVVSDQEYMEQEILTIPYSQATSSVRLIRDFQHGQERQKDLLGLIRNMMLDKQKSHTELRCQNVYLEEVVGGPVLTLGMGSRPVHVICSRVEFDKTRVNTEYGQITKENVLTNSPPETQNQDPNRLKVYLGTIATTPFPPSPTTPHPSLHAARYWESHNRIWLNRKLGKWLTLLDIGVSEESQVDKGVWVCNQPRSWAFRIVGCNMHAPWICAQVYRNGQRVKCVRDVMANSSVGSVRLKFGIVVDVGRGKVAFIDLNRREILHKFDDTFQEKLYPAFGVGPWRNEYNVDMTLVTGKDIVWSDIKKDLVHNALK